MFIELDSFMRLMWEIAERLGEVKKFFAKMVIDLSPFEPEEADPTIAVIPIRNSSIKSRFNRPKKPPSLVARRSQNQNPPIPLNVPGNIAGARIKNNAFMNTCQPREALPVIRQSAFLGFFMMGHRQVVRQRTLTP